MIIFPPPCQDSHSATVTLVFVFRLILIPDTECTLRSIMGEIIAEKRAARQNGYRLGGLISARTLPEEQGRARQGGADQPEEQAPLWAFTSAVTRRSSLA